MTSRSAFGVHAGPCARAASGSPAAPTCRVGRPARGDRSGRRAAAPGSRISGRLVAAIRMTPTRASKPSSSTSSWLSVCSRSSCATGPMPRALPSASSSSMKMMQGAFCLACSNRSRTRAAPTPTNISTKSEPLIEKNGTPASPATARASSVLPVPGGPTSMTPFGQRGAQPAEAGRRLEEVDHLAQLLLRLVDARDVGEADVDVLLHVDLGLAAPDGHEAVLTGLAGAADHEHPERRR